MFLRYFIAQLYNNYVTIDNRDYVVKNIWLIAHEISAICRQLFILSNSWKYEKHQEIKTQKEKSLKKWVKSKEWVLMGYQIHTSEHVSFFVRNSKKSDFDIIWLYIMSSRLLITLVQYIKYDLEYLQFIMINGPPYHLIILKILAIWYISYILFISLK